MILSMLNPFGSGAASIDPVDAVTMVKKGRAVLIDVREQAEYASGHARHAVNIPVGKIQQQADPASVGCVPALREGKPLILYCASGARSGMAARALRKLGHDEVFNLGSLSAWETAGGRVER